MKWSASFSKAVFWKLLVYACGSLFWLKEYWRVLFSLRKDTEVRLRSHSNFWLSMSVIQIVPAAPCKEHNRKVLQEMWGRSCIRLLSGFCKFQSIWQLRSCYVHLADLWICWIYELHYVLRIMWAKETQRRQDQVRIETSTWMKYLIIAQHKEWQWS